MMMKQASHALSFFLLLTIFTFISKKALKMFPSCAFLNYVVFVATQLKWAWEFLLFQSFCQTTSSYKLSLSQMSSDVGPGLGVRRFEGCDADVECSVCLCKVERGEEVRELTCEHVFHKACLDRWLGTGRMTCPLCRNHVKPTRGQLHHEVIVLDVFGGPRHRDRCEWWLR